LTIINIKIYFVPSTTPTPRTLSQKTQKHDIPPSTSIFYYPIVAQALSV